jgi:hypothetical protein
LTRAARAALFGACSLVVLLLALVPRPADSPLGRLANVDGDGPDPRYDAPLDGDAVRRAGRIVPDDDTYGVVVRGGDPLLQGNLKAAAQLFLAPALPVQDLNRAQWVLLYAASDPGLDATRLGGNLWLVHGNNPR